LVDWLIPSIFAVGFVAVVLGIGWRNTRRTVARTLARRTNLTRDEFVALLVPDVSPGTAEFVWDATIECLDVWHLSPHPDDHLVRDLPFDDDDPTMDWLPTFAKMHCLDWKAWPKWPADWEGTVRNFALWLELGLHSDPGPRQHA